MLHVTEVFLDISASNSQRVEKYKGMGNVKRIDLFMRCLYSVSSADVEVVTAQDEKNLSFVIRKIREEHMKAGLEVNLKKGTENFTNNKDNI